MVSIISGTNRKGSNTKKIALTYQEILNKHYGETSLIDLVDFQDDLVNSRMYDDAGKSKGLYDLQDHLQNHEKFIFITPEYNGSFPGVLKTFIDVLDISKVFKKKKCALIGVSAGKQGAAMAMSHLTDIFHHINMDVLANKPKLSSIRDHIEKNQLINPEYIAMLEKHANAFINF